MTRKANKRSANDAVAMLAEAPVKRALRASTRARDNETFYKLVGMRNPSRSYYVRDGRLHSLKAIVTHALREQRADVSARNFQAAVAARRLRTLGFDVVHFSPKQERARERGWIKRLSRPGQARFRQRLIDLYGQCPLSGCSTPTALEAAHVRTVADNGEDSGENGILLRVDLHKLFDANLIAIDPKSGRVHVNEECAGDYGTALAKVRFSSPTGGPKLGDFADRWRAFTARRAKRP